MPRHQALFFIALLGVGNAGCISLDNPDPTAGFAFWGRLGPIEGAPGQVEQIEVRETLAPSGAVVDGIVLRVSNATTHATVIISADTGEPLGTSLDEQFLDHPPAGLVSLEKFLPLLALRHNTGDWAGSETFLGLSLATKVDGVRLETTVNVSAGGLPTAWTYTMTLGQDSGFPREIVSSSSGQRIWSAEGAFSLQTAQKMGSSLFDPLPELTFASAGTVPPDAQGMPFSAREALEAVRTQNAEGREFLARNPNAMLTAGFYREGLPVGLQDTAQEWQLTLQATNERMVAIVRNVSLGLALVETPVVEAVTVTSEIGVVPTYAEGDFVANADSVYKLCEGLAGPNPVTLQYLDFGGTQAIQAGGRAFAGLVRWGCGDAAVGAPVWDGVSGCLVRSRLDS